MLAARDPLLQPLRSLGYASARRSIHRAGRYQPMADHLDAPGLMSPQGDARTDITDIYAFQKPGDPAKSILILNVNPLAPTLAAEFRQDAVYDLLIDTD